MSVVAPTAARHARSRRRRLLAGIASAGLHGALFCALLAAWRYPPAAPEPEPMSVSLLPGPPLDVEKAPNPPAAAKAVAEIKPPPPRSIVRRTRTPPDRQALEAEEAPAVAELGEGELAGAGTAETGAGGGAGGGGGCNMVRLLQNALRKDPLVQSAVTDAHRAAGAAGKALLVWNGDWVRTVGQEGKGLAAVREAILWEVGFAPDECRNQAVHGLVVVSLTDQPGFPRLAIGGGEWRWSDLLKLHGVSRG